MDGDLKKCLRCLEDRPRTSFYMDKSRKDGLGSYCKECALIKSKKWYLENTDKAKENNKNWVKNNPEKNLAIKKRWDQENTESRRIGAIARRSSILDNASKWRKINKDKVAARYYKRRDLLTNSYVALVMRMKVSECPAELISAKRVHIQIMRLIKEKK